MTIEFQQSDWPTNQNSGFVRMISMTRFRFHYRKPGHLHVCTSGTDLDDWNTSINPYIPDEKFSLWYYREKKENQVLMKSSKVKMLVLEKKSCQEKKVLQHVARKEEKRTTHKYHWRKRWKRTSGFPAIPPLSLFCKIAIVIAIIIYIYLSLLFF